jgi:hypothetical protein
VIAPLLVALVLATPTTDLKRARDRYEYGAWADAAGAIQEVLAANPDLPEPQAIEAYRILGLAEYQLGHPDAARMAFVHLLTLDPDYVLDPFLVPPQIVEFFDKVKRDADPQLAPLRERKKQLREQERAAEEARRKLLLEEQARSGPPARVVMVRENVYIINWLPFGAGQFQYGDTTKGVIIATSQVILGAINIGAILVHNAIVEDPSRRCSVSTPTNCSNPPIPDSDRQLLNSIDVVKYVSAGLFWGVYVYGVADALSNYVPRVETEITPNQKSVKLSWKF